MALINCSECSGKVSTTAAACPHCGAPVPPAVEITGPTQPSVSKDVSTVPSCEPDSQSRSGGPLAADSNRKPLTVGRMVLGVGVVLGMGAIVGAGASLFDDNPFSSWYEGAFVGAIGFLVLGLLVMASDTLDRQYKALKERAEQENDERAAKALLFLHAAGSIGYFSLRLGMALFVGGVVTAMLGSGLVWLIAPNDIEKVFVCWAIAAFVGLNAAVHGFKHFEELNF